MTRATPLSPERRHPADYRDEIEHAEVAAILAELPWDHRARVAYYTGAREACSSISLGHLLTDRMDLVERLVAAHDGHAARIWSRYSGAGGTDRHIGRAPTR